jgi:secreted trypsin-like serine protease
MTRALRFFRLFSAPVLALGALACTSTTAPEGAAASEDAIIGGAAAPGAELDAVGSLILVTPAGAQMFCSATLIAPTRVLTAKHCSQIAAFASPDGQTHMFTEFGTVYFAIGENAAAPRKLVKAARADVAGLATGGGAQIGSDVGVYTLTEAVTDVTPIPAATTPLTDADLGSKFTAIGYGVQDAAGTAGTRQAGSITFALRTGSAFKAAYGTFDAFKAFIEDVSGGPVPTEQEPALQAVFEQPLLEGYEAYFAGSDDVQSCSGDSGGPLLRKVDGHLTVAGVASWVPQKFSNSALCARGVVYATFGASALELIAPPAAAR